MAAICQFNQYGHCKFADRCDKFHNTVTCGSFPCVDNTCPKRHPRRCRYYDMYGRCSFAERCSFLHHDGRARVESEGFNAVVEDMAKVTEEIETLRMENTRLIALVEAQTREHNDRFTRLLEMIKDIKEEVDVSRVVSGQGSHRADNVVSSVICDIVPCFDLTCRTHYTEEGKSRVYNACTYRGPDRRPDRRLGDRPATKSKKGKSLAPGMASSSPTKRNTGGDSGFGRGQN
jgi:hypothetical protein